VPRARAHGRGRGGAARAHRVWNVSVVGELRRRRAGAVSGLRGGGARGGAGGRGRGARLQTEHNNAGEDREEGHSLGCAKCAAGAGRQPLAGLHLEHVMRVCVRFGGAPERLAPWPALRESACGGGDGGTLV
jgi:hypothetical protein